MREKKYINIFSFSLNRECYTFPFVYSPTQLSAQIDRAQFYGFAYYNTYIYCACEGKVKWLQILCKQIWYMQHWGILLVVKVETGIHQKYMKTHNESNRSQAIWKSIFFLYPLPFFPAVSSSWGLRQEFFQWLLPLDCK